MKQSLSDNPSMIDFAAILWGRKLFIILLTFLLSITGIIYSLLLPNTYKSKGIFLPPSTNSDKFSGLLDQLTTIPLLSNPVNSKIDPLEVLKAYLWSGINLNTMIEKFELKSRYKVTSSIREYIVSKYLKNLSIEQDFQSGLVTISFLDAEPEFAKMVVDENLKLLQHISKQTLLTESRRKQIFLEKRLAQVSLELEAIDKELAIFRRKNNILSIKEQLRSKFEIFTKLKSEKLLSEIKLEVLKELGNSDSHPDIQKYKFEITAMLKELAKIEIGLPADIATTEVDSNLPLKLFPKLQFELEKLFRKQVVHQEIYTVLAKQTELAKIETAKSHNVLEVVQWGTLPEIKFKPQRKNICLLFAASGVLISLLLVVGNAIFVQALEKIREKEGL
jgi:tyrosine-protein kinase Etk/Wzc